MIKILYILTFLHAFGFSVGGGCIEGDCVNGQGTMTWGKDAGYVGEFKDGVPHGEGTFVWAHGEKYVGEWKDGLYDGWGILTKANRTSKIGIWFNDTLVEAKTYTEVTNYLKAKYPESEMLKEY